MAHRVLDVRPLHKPQRHPAIFEAYDALPEGGSFVLVNDHDPVHLRDEFEVEHAGGYGWDYLDRLPGAWRVRISKLAATPLPRVLCDTRAVTSDAQDADGTGAVWRLAMSRRDLDANIVRLRPESGIAEHHGPDLDVLLLVLDGTGTLRTELDAIALHPGTLVWLPRRSRREFAAGPHGLAYLTAHQRRQSLPLAPPPPAA